MPISNFAQFSFTNGESSEELSERSDNRLFFSSVNNGLNMISHPLGPFRQRPGFEFINEYPQRTLARIMKYSLSAGNERALLVKQNGDIDVYKADGTLVTTIRHDIRYPATFWAECRYIQSYDVMIVFHYDYDTLEIYQGATETDWTVRKLDYVEQGFFNYN